MFVRLPAVLSSFLSIIALLVWSTAAEAQAQKIDVYEFGTYQSAGSTEVGTTPKGIVRSQTAGIKQLEPTRKVLALLGTEFGFRYKLLGPRDGTVVPITVIARFPEPGVLGRDTVAPVLEDSYSQLSTTGKEDFLTWTFQMKSDLVPGIWVFEIWSGGQKLTEQPFEVILPPTS